jgi:hypothetical protein
MKRLILGLALLTALGLHATAADQSVRQTTVRIAGEDFLINDQPTYAGRSWKGHRIEGLLLNSRMVQAIFDDLNPETAKRWAYPDTGKWDPERNVREFVAAMPEWQRHGLLAVTVNFQPMPILINEDERENFEQPTNNFTVAIGEHVSWGWFDYRRPGEGMVEGYQSPPVNWGLASERKRAFFKLCAEITGTGRP